ncbi:Qcr9 [Kluyveromyces lactis]|uniref:Cytochrome b-c1 complex subunit 9 n=2 Tax=Kluyveromyces lactis TaxID=28985 RepID=QCR9_KLULA|nr:RecName: Full=Cytochrome b-c1 complex subunit 9; AltName: Full=Complex III subunit 9 [Kluyveromyces lactis NRRL Y-1140]QEU62484.1 Qcr9 [Kluyveromyces lactis]
MSFASTLYKTVFKRNSVFVGTVFASAFVFQAAFDTGVTSWYENHNKGKLWKDIKGGIMNGGEEDEEDDE